MRPLASAFAAMALAALVAGLSVAPPGPARADAPDSDDGPMCRAEVYPQRAAYDAARVIQALRSAPPAAPAPDGVVPLNTRGYNYALPNQPRELSTLGAEQRMQRSAPGAPESGPGR